MKAVAGHPTAALAGVGGAGGFAHGMRKDEEGKRHLGRGVGEGLVGAAGGAALGHGVQKLRRGAGSVTRELPASPQHKPLAESSAKHAAPLLTAGAGAARAGFGSAIKGIAAAASRFARKPENAPTLVGAGLGGLGGLARGIHEKDESGQRHLGRGLSQGLSGALAGGMVGSVSGHLGRSMASGKSFGDAAKFYVDNWERARALT